MNTEQINRQIRTIYREFGQGNPQPFIDFLADDVKLEIPVSSNLPWAGTHQGKASILKMMADISQYGEYTEFELIDVISAGDAHVVLMRETYKVKATGALIPLEQVFVYRVRDSLAVEIQEYTDTAAIRDGFGMR